MQSDRLKFLRELMQQPSPSGFEAPAQKIIRARMKKFTDNVHTDVHGNVSGVLNPKAAVRVMLAGHVDEIGLMITHVDEKGFIYFAAIGGWMPDRRGAARQHPHPPRRCAWRHRTETDTSASTGRPQ